MKKLILILLISLIFTSCQKQYVCECFNPGGVFKTYNIYGSHQKAQQKCNNYSLQYQDVPMSETDCVLK